LSGQAGGHVSSDDVVTGIGPVFALRDTRVNAICGRDMLYGPFPRRAAISAGAFEHDSAGIINLIQILAFSIRIYAMHGHCSGVRVFGDIAQLISCFVTVLI
jgi:hypothetical protein